MDRIRERGGLTGYDGGTIRGLISSHDVGAGESEPGRGKTTSQIVVQQKMRNSVQQAIMTRAEDSVLLPLALPCITLREKRGGEGN